MNPLDLSAQPRARAEGARAAAAWFLVAALGLGAVALAAFALEGSEGVAAQVERAGRQRLLALRASAAAAQVVARPERRRELERDTREHDEFLRGFEERTPEAVLASGAVRAALADARATWTGCRGVLEGVLAGVGGERRFRRAQAEATAALHDLSESLVGAVDSEGAALRAGVHEVEDVLLSWSAPTHGEDDAEAQVLELRMELVDASLETTRAELRERWSAARARLVEALALLPTREAFRTAAAEVDARVAATIAADDRLVRALASRSAELAQQRRRRLAGLAGLGLLTALAALAAGVRAAAQRRAARHLATQLTAMQQIADAVMICDREGRIRYVNPAHEQVTGYSSAEAVGQTPRLYRSGQHDAEFYARLWETLLAKRVWSGRLVNRRGDGRLYDAQTTIAPVLDAAGEVTGYVSVLRDVSGQVSAERLRILGNLVSEVAHEINNPAHAISLGASFLEEAIADLVRLLTPHAGAETQVARLPWETGRDEVLRVASNLRDDAARIASFVAEVQRFGDTEPGVEAAPFDPAEAARAAVRLVRPELVPSGAQLFVDLEALDGARVLGHEWRLALVFVNLLRNAAAAVPKGTTPALRLEGTRAEGGVTVTVCDNGVGVAAAAAREIFDPFVSGRRLTGGRGLGLALCTQVVRDEMGGAVDVTASPAGGACFRVTLPALPPDAAAPQAPGPAGP